MKQIKEKLNNSAGASFLFALLLFLVAGMVSVTVITAAVTSLKRTKQTADSMQKTLFLESAALLIKEELTGAFCEIKTVSEASGGETVQKEQTVTASENDFETLLKDLAASLDSMPSGDFSVTAEAGGKKLSSVDAEYVLKEGSKGETKFYNMTITLTGSETKERTYLSFDILYQREEKEEMIPGNAEVDGTGTEITRITVTETYTWANPKMTGMPGGGNG